MKIGFLGGAFDPPHIGHYKIIEYCINIFDKLLIIPNKISPMHNKEIIASEYHRMNMLNLLFENENIKIDDFELSSNKKNYTYYTIKYLENKYKGDSLTMILGEDQLNNLDNWYNYEYIVDNMKILCFSRIIPNQITTKLINKIKFVDFNFDVSSSDIRELFKNDVSIDNALINKNIRQYIIKEDLYK